MLSSVVSSAFKLVGNHLQDLFQFFQHHSILPKQELPILPPHKPGNIHATSVSVNLTSEGLHVSEIKQPVLFETDFFPRCHPLQVSPCYGMNQNCT